jgi:hypothetical protein
MAVAGRRLTLDERFELPAGTPAGTPARMIMGSLRAPGAEGLVRR